MRITTKAVVSGFGLVAGIAGMEHGKFVIYQANNPSASLMFPSMGPPCDPEKAWKACEPAIR